MASPYLTSEEAAEFLRYETPAGFLKAVRQRGIPMLIRGRRRLFLKDDLIHGWARPLRANLREMKRRAG